MSVPTVSKVVNGRGDVAPDTRALIEDLLRQHQYVPRSTRRAHTTSTVELLIRGPFGGYVTAVIDGAVHAGSEAGTSVVISSLDEHRKPPRPRPSGPTGSRPPGAPASSWWPVT